MDAAVPREPSMPRGHSLWRRPASPSSSRTERRVTGNCSPGLKCLRGGRSAREPDTEPTACKLTANFFGERAVGKAMEFLRAASRTCCHKETPCASCRYGPIWST